MTFEQKHTDASYITVRDNRSKIVLKDKKEPRQYTGNNTEKKPVIVYRIDEGIVRDGEKCDYTLCLPDEKTLYFIELKGGDYSKALSQIRTTIDLLVVKPSLEVSTVNARIVLSKVRVPKLRNTEETKLDKLLKSLNGNLKKESQRIIESI